MTVASLPRGMPRLLVVVTEPDGGQATLGRGGYCYWERKELPEAAPAWQQLHDQGVQVEASDEEG